MILLLSILSILLLFPAVSPAQSIPFSDYHTASDDYSSVTLSPKDYIRAAELDSTELEAIIISLMDSLHVPGLSALVIKNEATIWQGQYGYANFRENRLVADTTLFMLASVSKPLTGTALMQLYEAGYFQLDSNINDYLPYQVINPYCPQAYITFRNLLTHTSSIIDNWTILDPLAAVGDPTIPLSEFTAGYLVEGGTYYSPHNYTNIQPDSVWSYSNVGVTLIGYLIEQMTGMTFEQFCQFSLFLPLGMNETSWFLANLDTNNIAMLYHWNGEGYIPYGHMGRPWYPAGQLRTSAPQLARFLAAFIQGGYIGSTRILETATVDTMLTLQYINLVNFQAIIWNYNYRGGHWVWRHGGSSWGTRTVMSFCPDDSIGVIVLTNGESGLVCDSTELLLYEFARSNTGVSAPASVLQSASFSLSAYPNPFNSSTAITFILNKDTEVKLAVYDVLGREIQELGAGDWRLGKHTMVWDASGKASGVYFVRLMTDGSQSSVMKVILTK